MADRLSRIVTRTGDAGSTGLGDGSRVGKTDPRIQALGDVDELNSHIGLVLSESLPQEVRATLVQIQRDLFDLGAQLSTPGFSGLTRAHLAYLDQELARWNADLAPLREFVLPGGCKGGALLHVARTVCRRAERSVAAVPESGVDVLPYLNRLSDLLFVLAREVNRHAGATEVLWR